VGRNRTVVDAVIPLHQSNGDRQRDMKAPCGCDSRKQALQVETGFFPEQMSDVVVLASVTHDTRRCIEHGPEAIQQVTR